MSGAVFRQHACEAERSPSVKLRPPIAVIVSRFPVVTETFILREIDELERQGQPVLLIPLLRQKDAEIHREAARWIPRALYTPFLSSAIVAANLHLIRRWPMRYFRILCELVIGSAHNWNVFSRTIALFPKSVYLARHLEHLGIRHVHAHFATYPASAALAIARLTGISYSMTAHAHDVFVPWRRVLLRQKAREATFVRVVANFVGEFLRHECSVQEGRVEVIHVGVEEARHQPEARLKPSTTTPVAATTPLGAALSAGIIPTVLCVAALKPYKGVPILLEACRQLAADGIAFRCVVVGDGPLRQELETSSDNSGLANHVTFLGARRQDEVAALMSDAALVVMPSVEALDGQMDGIPVALMEAMAAGRPVIASRLSGIPELIEHEVNGLLVTPGHARELRHAIERVISDHGLARDLGDRARLTITHEFNLETTVASLLDRIDSYNATMVRDEQEGILALASRIFSTTALGVRGIRRRKDSTVAEVLVAGRDPRELILKAHVHDGDADTARRHARNEYEILVRLHAWFADRVRANGRVYGVPRPEWFSETDAVLTMERCEGQPLVNLIRAARWATRFHPSDDVHQVLRHTGEWLRLFQACTSAGRASAQLMQIRSASLPGSSPTAESKFHATSSLDARVGRAMVDVESCVARETFSHERGHLIRRNLTMLHARCSAGAHRLVGQHVDFWPGNVYVSDGRLQVIDFEGFREASPYEDVAYFLVHLHLFFVYPGLPQRGRSLERAFLAGYLDGSPIDEPALALCRMAAAVQVLANRASLNGGDPAHPCDLCEFELVSTNGRTPPSSSLAGTRASAQSSEFEPDPPHGSTPRAARRGRQHEWRTLWQRHALRQIALGQRSERAM